jgi:hypothetical protein
MTRRRARRLDTAINIRNAALKKVKKEGQFEDTNIGPLLVWKGDEIAISHHTPFQKFPMPDEEIYRQCYAAEVDPKINLPYGLDIWDTKGKVLNIEWDSNDNVVLVSFRRGKWEQKVLHHMM